MSDAMKNALEDIRFLEAALGRLDKVRNEFAWTWTSLALLKDAARNVAEAAHEIQVSLEAEEEDIEWN